MGQALILNFDGENGATEYLEEVSGLSPLVYGEDTYNQSCHIDTSWSKFGAGSLLMGLGPGYDYGNLYYQIPDISGDLTAHAFYKPKAYNTSGNVYFLILHGINYVTFYPNATLGLIREAGVTKFIVCDYTREINESITIDDIPIDTEKHIAIVVKGLDVMLFVGGVRTEIVTLTNALPEINTFGMSAESDQFNVDAIEITDEALWDDDFTPPTSAPVYSSDNVKVFIPCAALALTGFAPGYNVYGIPAAGMTIAAFAPYRYCDIPAAGIELEAFTPFFGSGPYSIPAADMALAARNPSYYWTPLPGIRQNIYLCILTGDADGLDDLVLPMSSFQSTMRDGYPSYLACVIPNSIQYISDIIARTNGDIVVKKGYRYADGRVNVEEICRVDYEDIQIMRGGRSDSATISGHKTTTSTSPKYRALTNVSYYGLQSDGKRTYRAELDLFLRVGDYATYGGETVIVGQIMYIVDVNLTIMQITEA